MVKKKQLQQRTIKKSVEFSGITLHSGKEINLRFQPADVDQGVVFRRKDIEGKPEITAQPGSVVSTARCTILGRKYKQEMIYVKTVEHLMAACWGLKLDNLMVEVDGPEIPICDGSAFPFWKLLKEADFVEQTALRREVLVDRLFRVEQGDQYIICLPYDGFKVSYLLDFDHPVIGTQFYEFDEIKDSFYDELLFARTFGFLKEVEYLHKNGMALGGSLDNALLIGSDDVINQKRYHDEPVRHKILDLIGDMALNGFVKGHFICIRSGHKLNIELAGKIGGEKDGKT